MVFLGGIPVAIWLLVTGHQLTAYPRWESLFSVSMIPMTNDSCGRYTVRNDDNSILALNTDRDAMGEEHSSKQPKTTYDIWIIHNLWGLQFSAGYGERRRWSYFRPWEYFDYQNFTYERNMDYNEPPMDPSPMKLSDILPDDFSILGTYSVYCKEPTLITDEWGIGHLCKSSGYSVKMGGTYTRYEAIKIFDAIETGSLSDDQYYVRFHSFEAVMKDFLDTPEVYIAVWRDESRKVRVRKVCGYAILSLVCVSIVLLIMDELVWKKVRVCNQPDN